VPEEGAAAWTRIDILEHCGAGGRTIAPPDLCAVPAVFDGDESMASNRDHLAQPRVWLNVRRRIDIFDQVGWARRSRRQAKRKRAQQRAHHDAWPETAMCWLSNGHLPTLGVHVHRGASW